MEPRAEVRFAIDQRVALVILGGKEIRKTARVRNASPGGLQLMTDCSIPAGSAIEIELDNSLALGEVIYCRDEGDHSILGVRLEHVLNGLAELQRRWLEWEADTIPYLQDRSLPSPTARGYRRWGHPLSGGRLLLRCERAFHHPWLRWAFQRALSRVDIRSLLVPPYDTSPRAVKTSSGGFFVVYAIRVDSPPTLNRSFPIRVRSTSKVPIL